MNGYFFNHMIFDQADNVLLIWFWQTWWFEAGVIICLLIIPFYLSRKRIKILKHENGLLQQQFEECKELLKYSKENEQNALEETEISNRSKNVLLSKLSHEIRTPMNGIIGMASLLSETGLTSEQKEYAETIGQCGENLMTVINNMLISDVIDYTNGGQERIELESTDFNLPEIVEEVLHAFTDKVNQSKIELVYYIDENVPAQIVGDPSRLKQVLMNILENCVKFTTHGEIYILVHFIKSIDRTQVELGFEIKDTGSGLPKKEIEFLNRDISSIDAKNAGDSLGLIICKKLLALMGGSLKIESKEGTGTLFKFIIRARLSLQSTRSNTLFDISLKEKRILVIDDNYTSRTVLKKLLERSKLKVTLANSGNQALEILSQNNYFDTVLVDMEMPGMSGIEFMNIIHEKKYFIPAVLLCSKQIETYKEYKSLFKSMLPKPINHSSLYKIISNELLQSIETETEMQDVKEKLSKDFAKKYPLRILIAEDNITNQQIATMFLKKMGYEADVTQNGQEALETVSEGNYDLILMDVQMPVMDGLEATRMIRLCLNEQPVIIAMTANAMQGDRQECLQAGMDDYISKPIKLEEMFKMIEKWGIKIKEKH
jgi:CheY-like chemotaxis protein